MSVEKIAGEVKVQPGQIWQSSHGEVRVLAFAEGWIMLRQGTNMPYLSYWREFRTFYTFVREQN
jgi:hypothetical protein